MIDNAILSTVIARIYDCAIAPDKWPSTLALLCEVTESKAGTINVVDFVARSERVLASQGISSEWDVLYKTRYNCIDLFIHPLLLRGVGDPAISSELVDDDELLASRIYREWAAPQGFRDTLMTVLARQETRMAFLGLTRALEQRRYDASDQVLMGLIAPHVQRAIQISDLIEYRALERANLAEVVDAISTATIVIDRSRRVLHANRAGHEMLDRREPLSARNGVLMFPTGGNPAILSTDRASAGPPVPETMTIRGGDGRDYVLAVLPLHGGRSTSQAPDRTAVFVHARAPVAPIAPEIWAELFGLTGGELRVLNALVEGQTPMEIAENYGIARSIVKTHIDNLFAKTGTARQTDLVKLALGAIPPVHLSPDRRS
jgi:DNA-binding CsgD family transcriptional regulator